MVEHRPWLERVFGESWQTSLAGWGGGVLALTCIVLGRVLDIAELLTTGLAILTAAVMLLGQLARSELASKKAHQESLEEIARARRIEQAHHQESLAQIAAAKTPPPP
jgi:hypothetical protein